MTLAAIARADGAMVFTGELDTTSRGKQAEAS
jgi:hypothetical protein